MILVDSSIVIEALRRTNAKIQQIFLDEGAAICGIIRVEVLHGARDERHFRRLLTALAATKVVCRTAIMTRKFRFVHAHRAYAPGYCLSPLCGWR